MRYWLILGACALLRPIACAQQVEITSPDHAFTFAYGDVIAHQIERDEICNGMIARIIFSNYPYVGDQERRIDETFDFRFPGLRFDSQRNSFFAHVRPNGWIPVAELYPNFPYAGYRLSPNAKIILVKKSGRVTAILSATEQSRSGERWVQIDYNWSLQNLLAIGLEKLTR